MEQNVRAPFPSISMFIAESCMLEWRVVFLLYKFSHMIVLFSYQKFELYIFLRNIDKTLNFPE